MRILYPKGCVVRFLSGLGLMVLAGCATVTPLSKGDTIYWQYQENPLSVKKYFVIGKENDLYFRFQEEGAAFYTTYTDRRLTNTPYIKETNVQVFDPGFLVYFANEPGGGRFYIQPISSDDKDRKEISMQEVLKMSGK